MAAEIREVGPDELPTYAGIPIAFTVESVLRVEPLHGGLGGFRLVEESVSAPYVKDYDADAIGVEDRPVHWARRFDVSNWLFLLALEGDRPVGGAAVAFDSPGVNMLGGRTDLAVLWDIRVHPECRGQGIGGKLFCYAADWARRKGCRQLKVETQNVNVRACRFYAAHGCELGAIHRHAYAGRTGLEHEAMLLWYLAL